MQPRVNIITVHYNSEEDIDECLGFLLNSTYTHFQWWIVDNASTPHSLQALKDLFEKAGVSWVGIPKKDLDKSAEIPDRTKVILIENDCNEGFAAGNNVALRQLLKKQTDSLVWLLNPDVALEPEVMEDLVRLQQGKEKQLLGNVIYYYHQRDTVMYCGGFRVKRWQHGVVDIKDLENFKRADAIAGASLFTHLNTFEEVGLLPEHYFLYWEETDFCYHAKKKGYQFRVNTHSKIYDKVGSAANTSFTREYLYLLNGMRFYRKYFPLRTPLIFLSTLAKFLKAFLTGQHTKRKAIYFGQIDFLKECFGRDIAIKERIKKHA